MIDITIHIHNEVADDAVADLVRLFKQAVQAGEIKNLADTPAASNGSAQAIIDKVNENLGYDSGAVPG